MESVGASMVKVVPGGCCGHAMVTLSGRKKQRRGNRVSVAHGGVDGGAGGGRRSLECRLTPLRSTPLVSPELVHLWLCLWHLNSTHRY
jgi:hypothetical protein